MKLHNAGWLFLQSIVLSLMLLSGFSMLSITVAGFLIAAFMAISIWYRDDDINLPNFKKQLKVEMHGLRRAVWFHAQNNDVKKLLLIALLITWCVITVGISFGYAAVTTEYGLISALIWTLVGRFWGVEVHKERKTLEYKKKPPKQ